MGRELHLVLAAAAIVALATACAPISSITLGSGGRSPKHTKHAQRPGPPPHAPAHGHRQKHRGHQSPKVELVFDSKLGVYAVADISGTYFWDGYYFRIDGDQWYASVELDDGWEPRSPQQLPPGLQKKQHKAKKKHPHGKSRPAKGRW